VKDLVEIPVSEPYCTAEQRTEANHLGIWTFLATEILFFGGLFACYTIYRWTYPQAFAQASNRLEFPIGTINTAVLLTSSLFMALGDLAAKAGQRKLLRIHLSVTGFLGLVFLCLKGYEYVQKFHEHLVPGGHFSFPGAPPQTQLFFFLYFAMTGLHAAHMIFGLGAISWLLWLNQRGRVSPTHHDAVSVVGLYWHFVDCIWVFLYPLLYLIGR
jgi:cytochrome c oxidase subunit III